MIFGRHFPLIAAGYPKGEKKPKRENKVRPKSPTVLDAATAPQALDLPRYRLHPLKGDLKGLWSVTVRANWRIVFRFEGTDAFDVELIDYH